MNNDEQFEKHIKILEVSKDTYLATPIIEGDPAGDMAWAFSLPSCLDFNEMRFTNNPLKALHFEDKNIIQKKYIEQVKAYFPSSKMLNLSVTFAYVDFNCLSEVDEIVAPTPTYRDLTYYAVEVLSGWYFKDNKRDIFNPYDDNYWTFNQLELTDDLAQAYQTDSNSLFLTLEQIIKELETKDFSTKIVRMTCREDLNK